MFHRTTFVLWVLWNRIRITFHAKSHRSIYLHLIHNASLLLLLGQGLVVFCSVRILTNHKTKLLHYGHHVAVMLLISFVSARRGAAVCKCVSRDSRFQHLYHNITIRNENAKTQQRNMSYHRRPASEALEHSARIETPPRVTAALSSTRSLKFDMTKLFHAVQQQQDSTQFPIIAWASDDYENDSTASENTSSSALSSNEEKKKEPTPICKLTKRPREDSEGAHRMVRSKALYSELSLMSSSFSTSRGLPTQRNSIAAHLA
jgi:hypothetical protein